MPIIKTHELSQEKAGRDTVNSRQIYNGLDCMLTLEIHEQLLTLSNEDPVTYNFTRALQGPVLDIMQRGFRVDKTEARRVIERLRQRLTHLNHVLDSLAIAVWDKPLNPRSPMQLQEFLYQRMRLPTQWVNIKGERKISTNRDSLEKLELYYVVRPIVATILAIRTAAKQISVLETEVSGDGRMRTSYNIAGTETGRWSSSAAADGSGSNLQNWEPFLRRVLIADEGKILVVIDLEQAESREVGWLCGTLFDDWTYLDACEGGDLHTTTCRLIWPNLPWPADPKEQKALAESNFYRHYSYRDMSKRGGHGSNYYGKPFTMARHLKVPVRLMDDFQARYFGAFPAIPLWHQYVAQQLQTVQQLTTPFGRRRHFFGRPNDDTTLREAIAYSPQSSTAERTNYGLLRVWRHFGTAIEMLAQTHDSITFQCDEKDYKEIVPEAVKLVEIPISNGKRTMIVPGEAKVGWNWGNYHKEGKPFNERNPFNPNGLQKFSTSSSRTRLVGLDNVRS